jgi:hypothetical protein
MVQLTEVQALNAGLNFTAPASITEETSVFHLPDDATEEELRELASEQRAASQAGDVPARRPARETPGTIAAAVFFGD